MVLYKYNRAVLVKNCLALQIIPIPLATLFFTYGSFHVGYEPARLTVHPPPKIIEGGLIFFIWVSSTTKIFS